jgi:hypothetical protein
MDNPSDCGTDGVQNKLRTSTFDRGKSRADAIIYSLSNLHFTRKANERARQLKKRDIDIKPKPPSAWPRLSEINRNSQDPFGLKDLLKTVPKTEVNSVIRGTMLKISIIN